MNWQQRVNVATTIYASVTATFSLLIAFLALIGTCENFSPAKLEFGGFLPQPEGERFVLRFTNLGEQDTEIIGVRGKRDDYQLVGDTVIGGHASVGVELVCASSPCFMSSLYPTSLADFEQAAGPDYEETISLVFAHTTQRLSLNLAVSPRDNGSFWLMRARVES